MSDHDNDDCPHLVRASILESENARLKAEVEWLTWLQVETLNERNKAEAEVERLTKAEVERLRKEGEAMYPNLGPGWSHNAKEGKPSV